MSQEKSSNLTLEEMLDNIKSGEFSEDCGPTWEEYKDIVDAAQKMVAAIGVASNQVIALAQRIAELRKVISNQNKIIFTQEAKIRMLEARIRMMKNGKGD